MFSYCQACISRYLHGYVRQRNNNDQHGIWSSGARCTLHVLVFFVLSFLFRLGFTLCFSDTASVYPRWFIFSSFISLLQLWSASIQLCLYVPARIYAYQER